MTIPIALAVLRTFFLGAIMVAAIGINVKLDHIASDSTMIATIMQLNRAR